MKKSTKLISFALAALLVLPLLMGLPVPTQAAGQTAFDSKITVMGTLVTPDNAADVLGDADGAAATVYYDDASRTLTLDNAYLERPTDATYHVLIEIVSYEKTTINLVGDSTLKYGSGIWVSPTDDNFFGDLHITGNGTLTYDGGDGYQSAIDCGEGNLAMDSGTITANSVSDLNPNGVALIDAEGDVTLSGTAKIVAESINRPLSAGDHLDPGFLTVSGNAELSVKRHNPNWALKVDGTLDLIGGKITAEKVDAQGIGRSPIEADNLFITKGELTVFTSQSNFWAMQEKPLFTEGAVYTINAGTSAQAAALVDESTDYHKENYVHIVSSFTGTIPHYSMSITPREYTFPKQTTGFITPPPAQTFTVTNTGNTALQNLSIEMDTYDYQSFELVVNDNTTTLGVGQSITYTVQPKSGLTIKDELGGDSFITDVWARSDRATASSRVDINLVYGTPTYLLNVYSDNDDTIDSSSAVHVGEVVSATAESGASEPFVFSAWSGLDDVTFVEGTNQYSQTVKFVMPERDVTMRATYEKAIEEIIVSPNVTRVSIRSTLDLYAFVNGEADRSHEIKWTLLGNKDPVTRLVDMDSSEVHKVLLVGENEWGTLTVRAEDIATGAVYDEAEISISAKAVTWYDVTIAGGTPSSGTYPAGTILYIAANRPLPEKEFSHWWPNADTTLSEGWGVNTSVTQLIMNADSNVIATYKDRTWLPGDVTRDDIVNTEDLIAIINVNNYNKTTSDSAVNAFADVNGDDKVNFADLALARNSKYFGTTK